MESPLPNTPGPREGLGRFGVKLFRYRNLITKHWWVLAITVGLGLAYQGWVVSQKPRAFQTSSQLLIREEYDLGSAQTMTTKSADNFIGTQMQLLKSEDVKQRAKQLMELRHSEMKGQVPELSTSMIPRTQIFVVTGAGPEPVYTQHFVNAAVDSFIALRNEQKGGVKQEVLRELENKIADMETKVSIAQANLRKYEQENQMAFWAEQSKTAPLYLSGLKSSELTIKTELRRLQTIPADKLLVLPRSTMPSGADANNGAPGENAVSSLPLGGDLYTLYLQKSQELSAAESRLEEKSRIWKPKHPRLQSLKEDVSSVQRSIEALKKQNRESVAQRIEAYESELVSLAESIKLWTQKVQEASDKNNEYMDLDGKVKLAAGELEKLRTNRQSLINVPQLDVFQVVETAKPATEVSKQLGRHLAMGVLAGLFVGVLILVLLDRADDRMTSSTEILDQFSEPILGQIPNVADSRGAAGLPLLQPEDERYTYAEAFRSLRSSLIFMPNQTELRTILITSAIPNEGKSTIASNLAITMAAAGASVALIDADLRRGDIAALFDIDGRTGLSNVLRGEAKWEDSMQTCKYPNLAIMPRGPVTNQSSELLLLPSVHTLLDGLRDNFDLVIFNTAPILATDDTPSLSPNFDGTLMVMRAQFTSARLTQNSLNALYQRQVNVLGLVLNCVDTEMPDYYYYRYPKYYAAQ